MTDFMARILADPDTEEPRLGYADLLERSGQTARAEFVRAQCRIDSLSPTVPEAAELAGRCAQLLAAHEAEWTADLPTAVESVTWRRGCVEAVTIDLHDLVDALPVLAETVPLRRINSAEEDVAEFDPKLGRRLGAVPGWQRIETLDLSQTELGGELLRNLLAAPAMDGLVELRLGDADSKVETVEILLGASLANLRRLAFVGYIQSSLGDAGATLLAGDVWAERLTELYLVNARVCVAGTRALAESAALSGLRVLSLGGGNYTQNQPGVDGVIAIAGSSSLAGLENLDLGYNSIGDAGVEALAGSRSLRCLRQLSLRANDFSHDGFVHLSVADLLDTVEILDLSHNLLGPRSVESLVLGAPPALRQLELFGNPIEDAGVRMLANAPMSRQLLSLGISRTDSGDNAVAALIRPEHLADLEELMFLGNQQSAEMSAALRAKFGAVIRCC